MVLDCLRSLNITMFLNGLSRVRYIVSHLEIYIPRSVLNWHPHRVSTSSHVFLQALFAMASLALPCILAVSLASSDLVGRVSERESRKCLSDLLRLCLSNVTI